MTGHPDVATLSNILQHDGCSRCGEKRFLFVTVRGEQLCSRCWKNAGEPRADPLGKAHELEVRTREGMAARGGADAYRVRAGKT